MDGSKVSRIWKKDWRFSEQFDGQGSSTGCAAEPDVCTNTALGGQYVHAQGIGRQDSCGESQL